MSKKLLNAMLVTLCLVSSALAQEQEICVNASGNRVKPLCVGQAQSVIMASPTTEATFAPQTVITAAALNAAYQLVVDLPDGTKSVVIDNQTDGDVQISMTGGVSDTYHVKGGDAVTIPLATLGLVTTAVIQAKDGTSASASGSLYVYSIK